MIEVQGDRGGFEMTPDMVRGLYRLTTDSGLWPHFVKWLEGRRELAHARMERPETTPEEWRIAQGEVRAIRAAMALPDMIRERARELNGQNKET